MVEDFETITIDREIWSLLKPLVHQRTLLKGQLMMGGQEECRGVPIVLQGTLRFYMVSQGGQELTLFRVRTGEFCLMAAVCILGSVPYSFTIEAEEVTRLAVLPPADFESLMSSSAPFRKTLFAALSRLLINSFSTLEKLKFKSIEERILEYLHTNSDRAGVLKITHEKLAVELGSRREVVSRELAKLSRRGLINVRRGRIEVNTLSS